MKKTLTILLLHCILTCYAQQIKGIVINDKNLVLSDVLIELTDKGTKTKTISNENGVFEFKDYLPKSDSLVFTLFKIGYKTESVTITEKENLNNLSFTLKDDSTTIQLKNVAISGNKIIESTNKTIHKINSKDFVKNTKLNTAISSLSNLSISGKGILIDNRKTTILFIDGIEASYDEVKNLNVSEIDKVEVINNPSASFGSELMGGVIQIITKKKEEKFIKGELPVFSDLIAKRINFGTYPSISFKTKGFIIKLLYSYSTQNQFIRTRLERNEYNSKLIQQTEREVSNSYNNYLSARMRIDLSEKSNLNLTGNIYGYTLNSKTNGTSTLNNNGKNDFKIDGIEKLKTWQVNSVYNYKTNNISQLYIKAKFRNYENTSDNYYIEQESSIKNFVFSRVNELSSELVYENDSIRILQLPIEIGSGLKGIFRNFDYQTSDFNSTQNIITGYVNTDVKFNDYFSMYLALVNDYTFNSLQSNKTNYNTFLPSLSLMYKLKGKANLKFDYSKKITRPSVDFLNPSDIFYSPTHILRGNLNLLPEKRNLFELAYSKSLKNNSYISFKTYFEYINNAIVETLINDNNTIINSYENAGSNSTVGFNISYNTRLFKLINLNANTGITHNKLNSNTVESVVKENNGYSFNGSIYMSTMFFKDKISLSLIGNINTPYYTLFSTRKDKPYLYLETETNFFKDRLNVRLTYVDLFAIAKEVTTISQYENFYQKNMTNINFSGLSLSLTYNFGKSFSDRFNNPTIKNDDIKLKR